MNHLQNINIRFNLTLDVLLLLILNKQEQRQEIKSVHPKAHFQV